jgi:hypothetical protein
VRKSGFYGQETTTNRPLPECSEVHSPIAGVAARANRLFAVPDASAIAAFFAAQFPTTFASFFNSHESLPKILKG